MHKNTRTTEATCLIPASLKVWCLCQLFPCVPGKAAITTSETVTQGGRESYSSSFCQFCQAVYPLLHKLRLFFSVSQKKKLLIKLNKIKSDEDYLAKHFWCWLPTGYAQWNGWWENVALLTKLPDFSSLVLWKSSTASECLIPIQSWSQAAPCRFVHLAREMSSSVMEGIVQAETPPPSARPHLFHLPWALAHRQGYTRNGCELTIRGLLHSKASSVAHLEV